MFFANSKRFCRSVKAAIAAAVVFSALAVASGAPAWAAGQAAKPKAAAAALGPEHGLSQAWQHARHQGPWVRARRERCLHHHRCPRRQHVHRGHRHQRHRRDRRRLRRCPWNNTRLSAAGARCFHHHRCPRRGHHRRVEDQQPRANRRRVQCRSQHRSLRSVPWVFARQGCADDHRRSGRRAHSSERHQQPGPDRGPVPRCRRQIPRVSP